MGRPRERLRPARDSRWTAAANPGPCHTNCTNANEVFSFHPGGANNLFADGSVRFIKETTAIQVYANLISRAGGEVVSADSY